MIQASDLHKVWAAPDNTRLTAKQLSFRLPVHVAARLYALEELYPGKSRTQLVGDLLATALDEFERGFTEVKGKLVGTDNQAGVTVYEDAGLIKQYYENANLHYLQMEQELGNEQPKPLFPSTKYFAE